MKTKRSGLIVFRLILITGLITGIFWYSAYATDFDRDFFGDLAVGIPHEDWDVGEGNAGLVNIIYGEEDGYYAGNQTIYQDIAGGGELSEENDFFGQALAIGDFDCDGFADLVIGAPYENLGSDSSTGALHVVYGRSTGLHPASAWFLNQDTGILDATEDDDNFGATLAVGNFDGAGCDDLAIGVPGEGLETTGDTYAGAVQILYSDSSGLMTDFNQFWTEDIISLNSTGDEDPSEDSDYFGKALAAGDFNGDGRDDLAIGIPGEDIGDPPQAEAGAIYVMYGTGSGFTGEKAKFLYQNGTVDDGLQASDEFGSVLATGDFDGDGYDDLAVGIPYESVNLLSDAGAVQVFYGSNTGIQPLTSSQFIHRDLLGDPLPPNASDHFGWALAAGDFDFNGCDDLAIGIPDFDTTTLAEVGGTYVLYGFKPDGVTTDWSEIDNWHQGYGGLENETEPNDRMGYSLAAGNLNGDQYADLVIGVPYEDDDSFSPEISDAGAIHIILGSDDRLSHVGNLFLDQGSTGIADGPESSDLYGEVLAALPQIWVYNYLPLIIR